MVFSINQDTQASLSYVKYVFVANAQLSGSAFRMMFFVLCIDAVVVCSTAVLRYRFAFVYMVVGCLVFFTSILTMQFIFVYGRRVIDLETV